MDSCSLVCLAGLLISGDGLGDELAGHVSLLFLDYDTSGVTDVGAEEFLAHGQKGNASGAAESDVHYS